LILIMTENLTKLSIIIVNWNTRELLEQCIQSVITTIKDISYEVIVIDNGSTDDSQAMVSQRFPFVKLIRNSTNLGFTKANNQAIKISNGQYILLLNSDALLLPKTVYYLISLAESRPSIAIIGTQWLNPNGSFQASYNDFPNLGTEFLLLTGLTRFFYSRYYPSRPPQEIDQAIACDWVGGACLLVRMSAIKQVGLLDENFFMYAEEMDWCLRMQCAGWEVFYHPQAKIIHYAGQSAKRSSYNQQMHLYKSKIYYLRKNHGNLQALIFRFLVHIMSFVKSIFWYLQSELKINGNLQNTIERANIYWQIATSKEI